MVYLLHATVKHAHVQHYIGYVENKRNLKLRLEHHSSGNGSKYIANIQRARKERNQEPWVLVVAKI